MIESTLTGCKDRLSTIYHQYGEILLQNINISNSIAREAFAGYSIQNSGNILYSTFYNNEAYGSSCLNHFYGTSNLKYCNILSNKCWKGTARYNGIVLATNSKVYLNQCIFQSNSGYSLFCTWVQSSSDVVSIIATKCYFNSNSCNTTKHSVGLTEPSTLSIQTTGWFNLDNSHFYTALCHSNRPINLLKIVSLDKTKYKQNVDQTMNVKIIFDRVTNQQFNIQIYIDDVQKYSNTEISGSQLYQYPINIPNNLEIGSHKVKVIVSNTNNAGIISQPVSVSVEFEISSPFTMNIEDLEKTTYYHNIDKIIKLKGSYKGDDVDSFHCSIDDKEEEITHRSNYDDISQSYSFTAECKISSSINQEKGYTLKVWAMHSNEVSDVVIKQFSLKRNNPVLKVSDLSKGSYFHKRDSSISVSGYVSDIDGDESVTIESYIEGYQTTTRSSKSISIQSSSEYPFSLNVNIPDSLPRGNYRLIISCCDSLPKCASTIKRFYFDYNKPVLRVSDLSKDTYIHKRDSIITVSGSVSDIDGDESVTIESYIEGYQTTTRSSKSISIQSSSEYSFNLNVNIPDSLPRGNYQLIIRCCDSLPKCVSSSKRFYFEYNNPVLQIIKKPTFPVFINRDKFINFTLSVSDIDGNSHIRIYHSLNNTEGNLVNISLQEETSKEFDYNIPLPSDINAGDCLLKFYAVDEHNLYSDYKTLNVSIIKSFHTYKSELSYAIKRRR